MYNTIFFFEPSEKLYETPFKIGNLYMNRFTIDENAAYEIPLINFMSSDGTSAQEIMKKVMK